MRAGTERTSASKVGFPIWVAFTAATYFPLRQEVEEVLTDLQAAQFSERQDSLRDVPPRSVIYGTKTSTVIATDVSESLRFGHSALKSYLRDLGYVDVDLLTAFWGESASSSSLEQTHSRSRIAEEIMDALAGLLRPTSEESFEDGKESRFSRKLEKFISDYKNDALFALESKFDEESANPDIIGEAIRSIGLSCDGDTDELRFSFLVHFLRHPSPYVRDSAGIGLAYLQDARAIPYLEQAIERESCAELQHDLQRVIEQLRG